MELELGSLRNNFEKKATFWNSFFRLFFLPSFLNHLLAEFNYGYY